MLASILDDVVDIRLLLANCFINKNTTLIHFSSHTFPVRYSLVYELYLKSVPRFVSYVRRAQTWMKTSQLDDAKPTKRGVRLDAFHALCAWCFLVELSY